MCRLICRRFVALAVAYAVALNLVVPLLAAFALAADATPASLAERCAPDQSGASRGGDRNGHPPACPFDSACLMQDCGANGAFAAGASSAAILAFGTGPLLLSIRLDGRTLLPREAGVQFARAPPHA
jgi:hypothetical protein